MYFSMKIYREQNSNFKLNQFILLSYCYMQYVNNELLYYIVLYLFYLIYFETNT